MEAQRASTPSKHSVTIGGSSAGRILACPASYNLTAKMPKSPESSYAAEGTALHECIEYCLTEGLVPGENTELLIGKEFYGTDITADHVRDCIDPALRQFDQLYDELAEDGEVTYRLERQVVFPGIPDSFGTLDIIMSSPKRVVILDWKFGGGVAVSAVENTQMKFYAVAAAETLPDMFFDTRDPRSGLSTGPEKDVNIVIVQPRVNPDHPETWTTTLANLSQFKHDLIEAYEEATETPDPTYHRGEQCRWCSAQPICPLYKDVAQKLATMRDNGGMPGTGPEDTTFTQDDLADWMKTADIVTVWAKSVSELVMSEAHAGRPPTGKKLVRKLANTSYVWTDIMKIDRMLARFGLDSKDRRTPWKNISPTQAAKLLKKDGKELRKNATERLPGTVVLVDMEDKRDAIVTDAEKAKAAGEALNKMQGEDAP